MNLTLKEIYKVFNERYYHGKDINVTGISTDTRNLKKGDVFFAIKGVNDDGHNYINDAFAKGAILVVAQNYKNEKIIKVKNTRAALLKLASYYFKKMKKIKVFGITGSNGKTTVKEILYRILTKKIKNKFVIKSQKSFNNIIGIPLTIFKLNKNNKFLILEIGMNKTGEIKEIMKHIKINIAIITNIGTSHIGLLKSRDKIAEAKSEIFYGLKNYGMVVLNRDDEYYNFLLKRAKKTDKNFKIVSFGSSDNADLRVSNTHQRKDKLFFDMDFRNQKINIETKLLGQHNAFNIGAAAAASSYTKVSLSDIKKAVKNFKMKNLMRMEKEYAGGITIIKDCYNANPDSFKAALQFLKDNQSKNIIAVIGDMYELGKWTKKFHNYVGGIFTDIKLKKIIAIGKYSKYYNEGFVGSGGDKNKIKIFDFNKKKEVKRYLSKILKKGDVLFLKGSRKNKLEEILNALKFLYKRS